MKSNALEQKLGYVFRNPALLRQALVHPSSGIQPDNQRLEFLGDALFGAALTCLLYRDKPDWAEGSMTKLRHLLVSTETLHDWAKDLDFKLELPKNSNLKQLKTTFRKPMADAIEAILAAIHLDATQAGENGFQAVCEVVNRRFEAPVRQATEDAWQLHDAKTALQEKAAALGLPAPEYRQGTRSGPDHAPIFKVSVKVGTQECHGTGRTIKVAQGEAARKLLDLLSVSSKSSSPK